MTEALEQNIEKLKKVWYTSDPRYFGENPACLPIEEDIIAELDAMSDEELTAFADGLNDRASDLLFRPLSILAETRSVLKPKYD